jgi:hypothetical protein
MFPSITKIGKMSMNIGLNMKAILFKTVRMDKENYFCRMMRFLKEVSKKIWFGDREYL